MTYPELRLQRILKKSDAINKRHHSLFILVPYHLVNSER